MNQAMVQKLDDSYCAIYVVFTMYCALGLFFSYKHTKETQFLTDKEKKLLYSPEFKTAEV